MDVLETDKMAMSESNIGEMENSEKDSMAVEEVESLRLVLGNVVCWPKVTNVGMRIATNLDHVVKLMLLKGSEVEQNVMGVNVAAVEVSEMVVA